MTAPCYHCPDHRLGCHADCERYKAHRAECDAVIAKRRREHEQAQAHLDMIEKTKQRFK